MTKKIVCVWVGFIPQLTEKIESFYFIRLICDDKREARHIKALIITCNHCPIGPGGTLFTKIWKKITFSSELEIVQD